MKNKLREKIKKQRMEMSKEGIVKKSENIKKTLLTLSQFQDANLIMSYIHFRNEVETGKIMTTALQMGKRVVVPVCEVKTKKLIPAEIKSYPEDLQCGAYGIMEPCEIKPVRPEEIDLVLVPGVAFDVNGNRLGYGAGYYDRFLARLRSDATTIALAFEMQILDNVFPEEHDVPMDYIITEERLINCQKNN
ncbi:MAG: 5-formyltetrahydrofolate cyclo-ligase [Clostridia bacterium]|nr:5-formyltetrahydrofolate cyclo-ligase [Clostridiales bacterium]MDK2984794.1 5-formyltetrahydrofolate cyclo-ligase [Clostridia bacterium]